MDSSWCMYFHPSLLSVSIPEYDFANIDKKIMFITWRNLSLCFRLDLYYALLNYTRKQASYKCDIMNKPFDAL